MSQRILSVSAAMLISAPLVPTASAQIMLMVGDSSNDRIMLYDPFDGSLVNEDFIVDMGGMPYGFSTPKEAIQVDGQIWVVDQVEDAIHRFDLAGNYITSITTGLDNIRGGELVNNTIYVTNDASTNGAPGEAVVMFDKMGNNLGFFPINGTSAFDLVDYNGELVVTDFAIDALDRYDYNGVFLGTLAQQGMTTALNSPESLQVTTSNTLIVAGFGAPTGIYEYDSMGNEINYVPTNAGLRAVHELGNGNLMYTASTGIFVVDPMTMMVTDVTPPTGASGQNVSFLDPSLANSVGVNYCGPAVANSSGGGAVMSATGSPFALANNLEIRASSMPLQAFGFFVTSQTQGFVMMPGGSLGNLCLAGSIGRYVGPGQIQNSGAAGEMSLVLDLTTTPTPTGLIPVQAGETWNFTAWFRDSVGGMPVSNFADGLQVDFI